MSYKKTYKKLSLNEDKKINRFDELRKAKFYLFLSNSVFGSGVLMLFYVLYSFRSTVPLYQNTVDVVKPFTGSVLGLVYTGKSSSFSFDELSAKKTVSVIRPVDAPKTFSISIPKLNIEEALVIVDDKSLTPDDALGHYVGTALPGEAGNSFIYGHSTLPFFYNPKDYKTIFTKIPELKNGDRIYIKMQNKKLTYTVKLGRELLPKEIDPYITYYPEGFNKSTVTLMTCTPPGAKTYRYIVVAELEKSVKLENN